MNKNLIIKAVLLIGTIAGIGLCGHPSLLSQSRVAELAAGGSEWNTIKSYCEDNLKTLIGPEYAGWGWRTAVENYATAYVVLKSTNQTQASAYAEKALAIMKVLARHHNYGGPPNAQFAGLTDNSTTTFTLPFAPLSGTPVVVLSVPISDTQLVYNGPVVSLSHFDPILKITATQEGAAAYGASDYKLFYRDTTNIYALRWLTANHPANGAAYYVTMSRGEGTVVPTSNYTIPGNSIVFSIAPPSGNALFVRFIGEGYEQTGNLLGGMSSVTPDGPGYQMRTFNPGLAYGFDLLYDYAGFTDALKSEFSAVLNQQIDWYKVFGYENNGDLGNYFIRGLLTGSLFTAYGTEGANSRSAEFKTLAEACIKRTFDKLNAKLPGGYGPQGQYTNGVASDVLQVFSIYKDLSGRNLLPQLEWTSAIIPATIHGTKPDRVTFYDGGDWSDLPATPLSGLVNSFLTYLPDHPMAPFARQLERDIGQTPAAGTLNDYKTSFPLAYCAQVSGPIYARSSWDTTAVWISLSAGEYIIDHQHYDQGHITIQRGADYLLVDGGGYGDYTTEFHNTILFDDRNAGNISTYPPGQGAWGFESVGIRSFEQSAGYIFGKADFTRAYAQAHDGIKNSVKAAVRSIVFIRPDVLIVHDRTTTIKPEVKKIFTCNFPATPVVSDGISTISSGKSKLFMKTLVPSGATPVITAIANQPIAKSNLQELMSGELSSNFLHVFNATAAAQSTMRATALINSPSVEGAEVNVGDTTWISLFAKIDSVLSGTIKYTYSSKGRHVDLITDLQKSMQYTVSVSGNGAPIVSNTTMASSQNGTMVIPYPAADSGTVTLTSTGILATDLPHNGLSQSNQMKINGSGDKASISFSLATPQRVRVKAFDMNGRIVATQGEKVMGTGSHTILIGKNPLPAGTYLVRIELGTKTQTRTMVVAR